MVHEKVPGGKSCETTTKRGKTMLEKLIEIVVTVILIPVILKVIEYVVAHKERVVVCDGKVFHYTLAEQKREQEEKSALSSHGLWVKKTAAGWIEERREKKA